MRVLLLGGVILLSACQSAADGDREAYCQGQAESHAAGSARTAAYEACMKEAPAETRRKHVNPGRELEQSTGEE